MGLFFNRAKSQSELRSKAGKLVQYAHLNAIGSALPFLDEFPAARKVDPADWNFFVTIAAVFIGASRLTALKLSTTAEEELMEIVVQCLTQWDNRALAAYDDCKGCFEYVFDQYEGRGVYKGSGAKNLASDALGSWLMWNLFKQAPNDNELALQWALGAMTINAVFNWWSD